MGATNTPYIAQMESLDMVELLCAFIGGMISLVACVVGQIVSRSNFNKAWMREKKYDLYVQLICELKKIKVPIIGTEDYIYSERFALDVDSIKDNFDALGNYLDENSALIYLHLPKGVYKEILKLQNEIYQIISEAAFQTINVQEFKSSKIYDVIMQAHHICNTLREDLLKK